MRIAVLHGSTREGGNTEQLTKIVLQGIPHTDLYLRDMHIQAIHDQRHDVGGFDSVEDDYDALVEEVLQHDVLVFATPVYWYGMSGIMKNFFDRWSQSLRDTRYSFKESLGQKTAYCIVVGGDNPRIKALPLIQQMKYAFDYMGMNLAGYVIGKGSKPGDIVNDSWALREAEWLNQQLRSQTKVQV